MNSKNSKTCRLVRREIDESEMNLPLSEQAQTHVAACSACAQFRAERQSLRELVGSLEPVTAPADFDIRLRARMAADRQGSKRALFPHFLLSTPAIAMAAVIVMLAASIVWFSQRNTNQSTTTAQQGPPANVRQNSGNENLAAATTETNSNPANDATPPKATEPQDQFASTRTSAFRDPNRKSPATFAAKGRISSREFAVEPAEVIKQIADSPGQISLSAPNKPLVVSVEDDRGATHRILLPPVSFGAQRLVDNRTPVSTSNSRSW
jgi:hypothetical protein